MAEISGQRTLHRLIYVSSQLLDPAREDADIASIIDASVRRNQPVGITGLLLAHEGKFLQVLEGPAQAVLTTYGRICEDRRHSQARVISAGPAPERAFGDWAMCARRIGPADDAILATLAKGAVLDLGKLAPEPALRLLKAVRRIQEARPKAAREAISA